MLEDLVEDVRGDVDRETGKEETVTNREVKENRDFIDACMQTRPMQYVFKYCQEKVLCCTRSACVGCLFGAVRGRDDWSVNYREFAQRLSWTSRKCCIKCGFLSTNGTHGVIRVGLSMFLLEKWMRVKSVACTSESYDRNYYSECTLFEE